MYELNNATCEQGKLKILQIITVVLLIILHWISWHIKASPAMGAKFIKSKFQLILQMKIKIREEKKRKKMLTSKKKKDRFGWCTLGEEAKV